jgi:hypothetical protein
LLFPLGETVIVFVVVAPTSVTDCKLIDTFPVLPFTLVTASVASSLVQFQA